MMAKPFPVRARVSGPIALPVYQVSRSLRFRMGAGKRLSFIRAATGRYSNLPGMSDSSYDNSNVMFSVQTTFLEIGLYWNGQKDIRANLKPCIWDTWSTRIDCSGKKAFCRYIVKFCFSVTVLPVVNIDSAPTSPPAVLTGRISSSPAIGFLFSAKIRRDNVSPSAAGGRIAQYTIEGSIGAPGFSICPEPGITKRWPAGLAIMLYWGLLKEIWNPPANAPVERNVGMISAKYTHATPYVLRFLFI